MKDLKLMLYFLGLEVWQGSEGIFLNQGKYDEKYDLRCWNGHSYGFQLEAVRG
jgi:hypothetical protein